MVLSTTAQTKIKNSTLTVFDAVEKIAVSTSTTQDSSDTLSGEVERYDIQEAEKTEPTKYDWEHTVGLTDAVGDDLNKVGYILIDGTSYKLAVSEVFPSQISKTELIELNIGMELSVSLTDNTWSGT